MTFKEFPKWKYSAKVDLIVDDKEAEDALDGDWYDSPADLQAAQDAKADAIDAELRAKKATGSDDGDKTDLNALRAAAAKLGLKVHPKAGAAKLEEMIKAEIEKQGE